ncbi:MAG: 23S rRNA (uracil(1939)-C(5))-methyltransferase RlmD [Bacteroidales bacterium]|nr:23S rRNA (uracil(1939)-C(5))-methyltransferase RlmD [Bacteroidales bacterium]
MGKRGKLHVIENVTIESLAAEGKALAHVDGKVLFVPLAVPGDVVDVQLTRRRSGHMEGHVVRLHQPSPLRVEPVCQHFGLCGGCKWQHLPYAEQLRYKQQQVADQLSRIGHVLLPELQPIVGSARTECYRNKLEFTFASTRWLTAEEMERGAEQSPALGYHIPGRFDRVFDLAECHLQPEPSNAIRRAVRAYALEHGIAFMDLRTKQGALRNLIVRTASTGDVMVILSVTELTPQVEGLLAHLAEAFPQITSLMYVVNTKLNDTINDLDVRLFRGADHIVEQMEGIRFKVGPKSFYQTNSAQAYELYKVVRSFAQLGGSELVYDLYTGTGTIANFLARSARLVVGVEYVPEAIADAQANSALNGIANTRFFAGDMKDLLTPAFVAEQGRPDVVVLDPPRAGVHPDVLRALLAAQPQRMVYVSCNPATQARDLALLDEGYAVERVQPVDMFPHTHHVENVVLLVRR